MSGRNRGVPPPPQRGRMIGQLGGMVDQAFLKFGFNHTTRKFDNRPEKIEANQQKPTPSTSSAKESNIHNVPRPIAEESGQLKASQS